MGMLDSARGLMAEWRRSGGQARLSFVRFEGQASRYSLSEASLMGWLFS